MQVICYKNSGLYVPKDKATRNFIQKIVEAIIIRDISEASIVDGYVCPTACMKLHSCVSSAKSRCSGTDFFLNLPLQFTPAVAAPRPPPKPVLRAGSIRVAL